jgi:hypothetical protein
MDESLIGAMVIFSETTAMLVELDTLRVEVRRAGDHDNLKAFLVERLAFLEETLQERDVWRNMTLQKKLK